MGLVVSLAGAFLVGPEAQARRSQADALPAAPDAVSVTRLPPEARSTHRLILAGGPFPFTKDGTVFGNRERALPVERRGHYHEYTVPTPGARDRGARRIVCGGATLKAPDACFYTGDHYATFRRIAP